MEELERDDEIIVENGGAVGPLLTPRIDEQTPVNPNLSGIPMRFPEGSGLVAEGEREEAAQMQLKQVWRDTLDQSVINSAFEYFSATPDAVAELWSSGTADLEPHRPELTEGVPLHLHDQVMGKLTLSAARARADRIREDQQVQARLAQQVGISRSAVMLAGGLLDADLPLMFASGGTLAAGRTALTVARTTKALTGSTALGRVTGDFAVGISGGALSGTIVGGTGMMVRDDYDVNTMFQMVLAGAATGGVLNPTVGRVLPDREVWEKAAELEVQNAVRVAEKRFHEDMIDPDTPINDRAIPVNSVDAASTPVSPSRDTEVMEPEVAEPSEDISPRVNTGGFDLEARMSEGDDASAWAYDDNIRKRTINIEGIGSGKDAMLRNAEEINTVMDELGMSDAVRIGEGNSKIVFGNATHVVRIYYGTPDKAIDHPNVQRVLERRKVSAAEYKGRTLMSTGFTIEKMERVTPLTEKEAREWYKNGKFLEEVETMFGESSVELTDLNPANMGRRADGTLVMFDGVSSSNTDDLVRDLSYPGSIGAAQAQPVQKDITGDTIGLSDSAPQSVQETSVRMQKWRQDYAYHERLEEDTQNPLVRLLTGNANYEVRVPFSDTTVDIGQLLGSVFTLAQRDFTKMVRSGSPTANFVAAEILESSSGLVRGGSSAAVLREMFHSSALVHSAAPLRDFRGTYFRSRGLNPVRIESHRQFSADIRVQMQRRYMGQEIDAEFVDVIDKIDRTHAEILGHLQGIDADRAVRGAREIEHRPGYFRYAWEPERFLAILRRENGERDLVQSFRDGYMRASGIDKDTAESIASAVVRRFRTRGVGRDAADSRLLDLDSRSGIEEVLEGANMPRAEIDRIMQRITAQTQERTKKGYLKQRVEVDLSTRIPGSEYRLVDLMSDDFERSLHQYVGDASGAAALAHKGIRDKAELNNILDTMMEEQFALGETALKREEVEAIFSQFTGGAHRGFIWGQSTSGVSPLTSTLTKSTRISLLQRAGLTQLMDTSNMFVGNGVARTMEPIMAKLGWDKPGAMSRADMQSLSDELDSIGVVAGRDHDIFAPHMSIDETDLAQNVLMNAAQRGMGSIERITHFVSGQTHVTAFQQQIAASAVTTNVIKTLAGQETNLTTRMLRDIGLEPDRIHEIVDLIEQGVIKVDGSKVELNSDQWSPDLKLEFGAAVTRAMHQQAQKGLIGETSVWMNSDIGKLLSALKTFSLVATQKQMARNLMIGGSSHFITASAWQLGFAYAVLTLSQSIQGTEMDPADRGWLAAAYTPNIGTVPMIVDPMTSMLGFDDLNFSPYGRYASYLDTPVFEVAGRLSKAPGGISGMLSGEGTYDDMQNARAMFFLNWYGMKRLWEEMK